MTAAVRALRYLRVSRADQNVALQDDDTAALIERRSWVLVIGSRSARPTTQSERQ